MNATTDNKSNPINEARELYANLFGDKLKWANLHERYSSRNVYDYVEKCVNENYYIEAHCVVLQYIIKSLVLIFSGLKKHLKNHVLSDRSVIVFMEGIGFLENLVLQDWDKLITERNNLAHKLIDNVTIIEKYTKEDKVNSLKFLYKCIDNADCFFIKYFKKPPYIFQENDPKIEHLVDIAIQKVKRTKGTWSQDLVKNELRILLK